MGMARRRPASMRLCLIVGTCSIPSILKRRLTGTMGRPLRTGTTATFWRPRLFRPLKIRTCRKSVMGPCSRKIISRSRVFGCRPRLTLPPVWQLYDIECCLLCPEFYVVFSLLFRVTYSLITGWAAFFFDVVTVPPPMLLVYLYCLICMSVMSFCLIACRFFVALYQCTNA